MARRTCSGTGDHSADSADTPPGTPSALAASLSGSGQGQGQGQVRVRVRVRVIDACQIQQGVFVMRCMSNTAECFYDEMPVKYSRVFL